MVELKEKILKKTHDTPYTTHSGSTKMYQDLCSSFWWDKMKKDKAEFVQRCLACQQVKAKHKRTPGLLVPLPILE